MQWKMNGYILAQNFKSQLDLSHTFSFIFLVIFMRDSLIEKLVHALPDVFHFTLLGLLGIIHLYYTVSISVKMFYGII